MAQEIQNDFLKMRELRGTSAYEKNKSLARLVSTVDWFHPNADLLCENKSLNFGQKIHSCYFQQ